MHNSVRGERCRETGLWLVSADVTGERDGRISLGPTAVPNPAGEVVAQLPRRFLSAIFLAMKRRARSHFQFELWAYDIFDVAAVKQQLRAATEALHRRTSVAA